jgi:hypothetical protein
MRHAFGEGYHLRFDEQKAVVIEKFVPIIPGWKCGNWETVAIFTDGDSWDKSPFAAQCGDYLSDMVLWHWIDLAEAEASKPGNIIGKKVE